MGYIKGNLIIVGGMSGAGKSTTSKKIVEMLIQNGVKAKYHHEEKADHPIRWANGGEFTVGDLLTYEGMKLNVEDYYGRWKAFLNQISDCDHVHVMEGCLFQTIQRYLQNSCFTIEDITDFYDNLYQILYNAGATLIYLKPDSVEQTLKNAFETRGNRWKSIILNPEGEKYFDIHGYDGEISVFNMYKEYVELANLMFKRYEGDKLLINVPSDISKWNDKMFEIAYHFNISPIRANERKSDFDFPKGKLYRLDGKEINMHLNKDDVGYYLTLSWWDHMTLVIKDHRTLEAESFPIRLEFEKTDKEYEVKISGGYMWEIDGETLKMNI